MVNKNGPGKQSKRPKLRGETSRGTKRKREVDAAEPLPEEDTVHGSDATSSHYARCGAAKKIMLSMDATHDSIPGAMAGSEVNMNTLDRGQGQEEDTKVSQSVQNVQTVDQSEGALQDDTHHEPRTELDGEDQVRTLQTIAGAIEPRDPKELSKVFNERTYCQEEIKMGYRLESEAKMLTRDTASSADALESSAISECCDISEDTNGWPQAHRSLHSRSRSKVMPLPRQYHLKIVSQDIRKDRQVWSPSPRGATTTWL
jgi:hypothetical protein